MRKGITDNSAVITDILNRAEVLWLALADEDGPYSVPVNFAVAGDIIYIHSGLTGRKAACLESGAPLAFSTAVDVRRRPGGDDACDQGYHFRSIMGRGTPRLLEGEEKMAGLDAITMKHLGRMLPYKEKVLPITALYAIDIESVTARVKE
ncbi:pyridoxamine 5'-phosphate oxidase family protein [Pseudodesulfovibrio sp.]|uniref:pyridoxamine 5'-phosphate oxidase family protein n=1 Tax=unclassified Pseudodesulfovibrio TaxID=2661612 RepID=UPI003B00B45D